MMKESSERLYFVEFWLILAAILKIYGRHLYNHWVKIYFVCGNEFSNQNYMGKDILHERIEWTVDILSNFGLFWRPF